MGMTHTRIVRLAALAAVVAVAACETRVGAGAFVSLPISNDPSLASLSTSAGTLDPTFSAARTAFTLAVPDSVGVVRVTPTAAQRTSTIQVNGQDVTSGSTSLPIVLPNVGSLSIPIRVTAAGGSVRTYTVSVLR